MRHVRRKPYIAYFIVLSLAACLLLPACVAMGLRAYMLATGQPVQDWQQWSEALAAVVAISVPAFVALGLLGAWIIAAAEDDEHAGHRFAILFWALAGGSLLLNLVYVQALWDVPALMEGVLLALQDRYELFLYVLSEAFVFGGGAIVGGLFAAMIGQGHHGHHHQAHT